MYCTGQRLPVAFAPAALQSANGGHAEFAHPHWVISITLASPAPPRIQRHGQTRGQSPGIARGQHLRRRYPEGLLHQARIPRGAQANRMRKDDRALHVVMAMHRVHTKQ